MKKLTSILFFGFAALMSVSAQGPAYLNTDLSFEERVNDLVGRMTLEEKAAQLLYTVPVMGHTARIPI